MGVFWGSENPQKPRNFAKFRGFLHIFAPPGISGEIPGKWPKTAILGQKWQKTPILAPRAEKGLFPRLGLPCRFVNRFLVNSRVSTRGFSQSPKGLTLSEKSRQWRATPPIIGDLSHTCGHQGLVSHSPRRFSGSEQITP